MTPPKSFCPSNRSEANPAARRRDQSAGRAGIAGALITASFGLINWRFHFLAYLSTNRFGGILADDMGLGKTLQTLAWLLWLREGRRETAKSARRRKGLQHFGPALVVCPKSVMDNWRAEAAPLCSRACASKSGRPANWQLYSTTWTPRICT